MGVFDNIKFPFLTHQQLNLDWILSKLKDVLSFIPEGGTVGQILRRTNDGADWSNETVESVNGKTGTVALNASDVGALANTLPHVTGIGKTADGWSWELYNDNTVDLYMTKKVTVSEYASTSYGGLYQFGPFALPFALEAGYSIVAGCKIGEGISIVSECNAISTTYFDVNGQSSLTGQQTCDVYAHVHGKMSANRNAKVASDDISKYIKKKDGR